MVITLFLTLGSHTLHIITGVVAHRQHTMRKLVGWTQEEGRIVVALKGDVPPAKKSSTHLTRPPQAVEIHLLLFWNLINYKITRQLK